MVWSSPNGNELRHHAALTSVTLTSNLLKELGGIVTTLGPSSPKIFGEPLYLGWSSDRPLAFRKLPGPKPPADSLPLNLQRLTDCLLRMSFAVQLNHLLVTPQTTLPTLLLPCFL
jgi:hypothetical protein